MRFLTSPAKFAAAALASLALAVLVAGPASAQNQGGAEARDPALSLELNKLEDKEGACLAYLVLENPTDADYTAFLLDLIVFQTDGVIARRLAIQLAPLLSHKTTVKLFEIPSISCDQIGRVLVNAVPTCTSVEGEVADCIRRLTLRSRTKATFDL